MLNGIARRLSERSSSGKAEKVGIGLRILERELAKMVRRINSVLPKLVRRAASEHPSKCYDVITDGISRRIGQIEL